MLVTVVENQGKANGRSICSVLSSELVMLSTETPGSIAIEANGVTTADTRHDAPPPAGLELDKEVGDGDGSAVGTGVGEGDGCAVGAGDRAVVGTGVDSDARHRTPPFVGHALVTPSTQALPSTGKWIPSALDCSPAAMLLPAVSPAP